MWINHSKQKCRVLCIAVVLVALLTSPAHAQVKKKNWKYMSFEGLVMAGYQGWFNAEGDSAGRGWFHYAMKNRFEPGATKVDYWPDVSEYPVRYKTPFSLASGDPAYVFSSYDESTVDLHFKWMKAYGIDGVFMQRFVSTLKDPKGSNHYKKVLGSAVKAAQKYDRAIAIMYDLSGMNKEDYQRVIDDWKMLVDTYKFNKKEVYEQYLFHRKKPLVAIWGAGFNDGRKYGLEEVEKIIDFLKNDPVYGGCSVLLGVPTWWRELKYDTQDDPKLHQVIKKVDIVHPWFVGRYNEETYPGFKDRIKQDLAWCTAAGVDYVPVAYPGFSWQNMRPDDPFDAIPRNKGSFFWKQLSGAIGLGAQMIYVAMFDEIDEGTAIFKCAKDVPVGASRFVPYEKGIPSDHYLWLAGQAAGMLKKEIPFQATMPYRTY
jgi:glycoprotein endo-alpha-1,2-mannosidase